MYPTKTTHHQRLGADHGAPGVPTKKHTRLSERQRVKARERGVEFVARPRVEVGVGAVLLDSALIAAMLGWMLLALWFADHQFADESLAVRVALYVIGAPTAIVWVWFALRGFGGRGTGGREAP